MLLGAVLLPFASLVPWLGFLPLSTAYFGLLAAYLSMMVQESKQWVYQKLMKV